MTYQTITGTLNPVAHPGSYNGQDVYSDLLVVENSDGVFNSKDRHLQTVESIPYAKRKGLQRCNRSDYWGGGEALSEPIYMSDRKGHNGISEDGTATTLTAQEKERPMVGKSIVRRLTPTECMRLQGFPDDWCDLGEWTDSNGKKHKDIDTPKYKAAGNSIARPFWQWLTRRIAAQYEGKPPTLGSLFDGIGGFPLSWAEVNGPDSVIWASEIEEFPIAVTKKHFGDDDAGIEGDIQKYL